ncbi:MAG: efflux RND transporter periplasmic adaptor subunit [Rhizobiales bacterium]|nr:efflux RND transporter periplasmic adaptor subunit [Hyphomicrobiales bacterium]
MNRTVIAALVALCTVAAAFGGGLWIGRLSHSDHPPALAEVKPHSDDDGHSHSKTDAHNDGGESGGEHAEDTLTLTDRQIKAAAITLQPVATNPLREHILVSGAIAPDADRVARVAVSLTGTVSELRKRLGDPVEKGEVVAVIESRELSDAKSEYLAARLTSDLQQTLLARQQKLLEQKAVPENDYLRARLTAQDAQIRLDSARQKLLALGLPVEEIEKLPEQSVESLRKQALRSPIRGRIAERRADLGALVGREGQESEIFVVVDLDRVWIDLALSPSDAAKVREGAAVRLIGKELEKNPGLTAATIVFVSPLIDKDTRAARVIAALPNPDHGWRPGTFVTAEIFTGDSTPTVVVPKPALQTIEGKTVVFVRAGERFEARPVRLGREDDDQVEIVAGVKPGEIIAVTNTFTLKAELGKRNAAHEH